MRYIGHAVVFLAAMDITYFLLVSDHPKNAVHILHHAGILALGGGVVFLAMYYNKERGQT